MEPIEALEMIADLLELDFGPAAELAHTISVSYMNMDYWQTQGQVEYLLHPIAEETVIL